MRKEIIDGINYRLNEDNLTAEIVENEGNGSKTNIPEIVVFNEVSYRVTCIKEKGFSGYPSMTSIIIPDSVTEIGARAFANCHKLTDITIPNSVTSIGAGAFQLCFDLTSITIPKSVTSIGEKAFEGCKSLTNITFQGTIAQWNEIDFGNRWNYEVPAKFVHCTDGDFYGDMWKF